MESFYADRRRDGIEKGNSLVSYPIHSPSRFSLSSGSYSSLSGFVQIICCEGNAGFSEIGICGVPLEEGYSVLAWNHPGFGSSMVCVAL